MNGEYLIRADHPNTFCHKPALTSRKCSAQSGSPYQPNIHRSTMGALHDQKILKDPMSAIHLPYMKLDNFPQFSECLSSFDRPFAVPAQDRLVDCPSSRNIKHAPCSVLFLVCEEAKLWAEPYYHRLQPYKRDYDIIMGDLVPESNKIGLLISLNHDIFVIQ